MCTILVLVYFLSGGCMIVFLLLSVQWFHSLIFFTSQESAVRDPTLYKIPCCTRFHDVQDPVLFEIPRCTRSHAVRHPTLYKIPHCTKSHAVQETALYKIPRWTRTRTFPKAFKFSIRRSECNSLPTQQGSGEGQGNAAASGQAGGTSSDDRVNK